MVWTRIICAIITFVFVIVFSIVTSNQREYRYRIGYGPCLSNLIENAPKEVGLAAIGGSRILTLMMSNEVKDASMDVLGAEIEVVNFAKSWYGPDYELQLLEDIYSNGIKIDNLLVQLEPQRDAPFHPHAYSFLESDNIVDSAFNSGLKSQIDGWSFLIQSHMYKLRDMAFSTGKKNSDKFKNKKYKNDRTCYKKDFKLNKKKLNKLKKRFRKRGFSEGGFNLSKSEFSYSDTHYKKIVNLAKLNNTKVFFIRVPKITTSRLSDSASKAIEENFEAKLIRFPLDLRQEIFEDGYRDGSHINQSGRSLVLPWLLKEVYNSKETIDSKLNNN